MGARRSFSLANLPASSPEVDATDPQLELFIKRYPGGRISGLLESGAVTPGTRFAFTGPYGAMKTRPGEGPVLMIAGGSGMAPILSLLRELASTGTSRPIHFFYGARSQADLFHTDEIRAAGGALTDFTYTPVTDRFVHEAVDAFLAEHPDFAAADARGRRGDAPVDPSVRRAAHLPGQVHHLRRSQRGRAAREAARRRPGGG
jgi:NAD(P)H-flavin reductase